MHSRLSDCVVEDRGREVSLKRTNIIWVPLMVLIAAVVWACAPIGSSAPTPTFDPSQVLVVGTFNTPSPAPATETPVPTDTEVPPIVSPTAFNPLPSPVSEEQGNYVTSMLERARYYYYWTDRRWKTLEQRIWFATVEDLHAWYPNRVPAP